MLEKQRKLRKVEFVFTDDEVNPVSHCEYDIIILEDGVEIARTKERENKSVSEMRTMVSQAKEMGQPEIRDGELV